MKDSLLSLNINSYDSLVSLVESSHLNYLPIHLYWKDKQGKYLGNNNFIAQDAGFSDTSDLYGKRDHDLSWSHEADTIRENDKSVLFYEKPRMFVEFGTLANGNKAKSFSYKLPLHTAAKKLVGILGLSFIISDSEIFFHNSNDLILATSELNNLTKRQKECAYWLGRGYTQKQIARTLKISPRTVEHYLEAIKDKLNCNNRPELIEKISAFIRNQNVFLN